MLGFRWLKRGALIKITTEKHGMNNVIILDIYRVFSRNSYSFTTMIIGEGSYNSQTNFQFQFITLRQIRRLNEQ